MDLIVLASAIAGLTGFSLRDVLKRLSHRGVPIRLIATANTRLLSMLTEYDDEITGRWYVSKWLYFWKDRRTTQWEEAPYHVDGYLYVFYQYRDELRWKGTLILNYTWRRGRKTFLPKSLRDRIDRHLGKSFKGVYDIEIQKKGENYFGQSTMIFRSPDLGTHHSGLFENLKLHPIGVLSGHFKNIDPLPEPMVNARAEVAFQQRKQWNEFEIESEGNIGKREIGILMS